MTVSDWENRKMKKSKLGKTQFYLSEIGLGTVQFGMNYGFAKEKLQEEVEEILRCAEKAGINLIDTAREYGTSEQKIGKYLSENQSNIVVATKLKRIRNNGNLTISYFRDCIYKSLEESLRNLKMQHIDLLQLHQADQFLTMNSEFWTIIETLKDEGIIKAFGVSVYEEQEAVRLINQYSGFIDFLQIPYNIFDRRFDFLQDISKKNSLGIISRSVFLKGIIPCAIESVPKELDGIIEHKMKLKELAESLDLTSEELALLYVVKKRFINSTLIGANSVKEMDANIKTIEKYKDISLDENIFETLAIQNSSLIDPRKWNST